MLRVLDPQTDRELYREAYEWRHPKKHTQPDRIDFEDFAASDLNQLTFGLFDGEKLDAVYFLREWCPAHYEAHFTSRKNVSRETLTQAAKWILDFLLDNGAVEVSAFIVTRNFPLRRFVTQIGMSRVSVMRFFSCIDELDACSIAPRNQRTFVKYAKRV